MKHPWPYPNGSKGEEAIERGEFDDFPGKGKPLHLGEDDRTVPEELRLAYRMLKNAGLRDLSSPRPPSRQRQVHDDLVDG